MIGLIAPESAERADPAAQIGERGTGRELVARAIHTRSPRREGRFVKIAAAAAEPGDFAPLFEAAAAPQTTIYLENVSELRTAAQAALELWLRPRRERLAGP